MGNQHLTRAIVGFSSLFVTLVATADHQQGVHGHPTAAAYASVESQNIAQPVALEISDSQALSQPMQACMPDAADDKPALRSDCMTVLEDVAKRKGRYAATSRNKRELRSLCANQWLPRCRHKY
ncbi:MAG: hypothetical protein AB8B96_08210 [Lysobacterales bacterium]